MALERYFGHLCQSALFPNEQSQRDSNPCRHLESVNRSVRSGALCLIVPVHSRYAVWCVMPLQPWSSRVDEQADGQEPLVRDPEGLQNITVDVINESRYHCRCDPVVPRQGDRADLEQAANPPDRRRHTQDRSPEATDSRRRRGARRPQSATWKSA